MKPVFLFFFTISKKKNGLRKKLDTQIEYWVYLILKFSAQDTLMYPVAGYTYNPPQLVRRRGTGNW